MVDILLVVYILISIALIRFSIWKFIPYYYFHEKGSSIGAPTIIVFASLVFLLIAVAAVMVYLVRFR